MRSVRAAFVVCLVLAVASAAVASGTGIDGPAGDRGPTDGGLTGTNEGQAANPNNATNASLGSAISSFMQSNAARTTDTVESEMWVAAYENASSNGTRTAMIEGRTEALKRRIALLRERKRALRAARENGTIPPVAYRARMSRIVGRLAALSTAIEATDRRAAAAGVNTTELDRLRRDADRLSGGEIREIARGLAGPDGAPPGPPEWLDADAGNGSDGKPPDERGGPPAGTPPGRNATDGNESDDRGAGGEGGAGNGGAGNGGGDGNAGGDGNDGDSGQGAGNGNGGGNGNGDDSGQGAGGSDNGGDGKDGSDGNGGGNENGPPGG